MKSISFAGTAKNTGKTTTCLQVMEESRAAGIKTALTSIGYDGELKDNVTGLPKPRYMLQPGDMVATAADCLRAGTADIRIEIATGVKTVLGEVLIGEIRRSGLVVLAGPNRSSDLTRVLDLLAAVGADLTLVDGALNRLAPVIATDGLVLATGAAFDNNIQVLAEHARALCELFRYPSVAPDFPLADIHTVYPPLGSLLGLADLEAMLESSRVDSVCIPNACDPSLLNRLLKLKPELAYGQLVLGSPLKIIASGDPREWNALFKNFNLHPKYLRTLPLHMLSLNPFYPKYLPGYYTYEAAAVDKTSLRDSVRAAVNWLPVLDIKQQPFPNLLDILAVKPSFMEISDARSIR